MLLRNGNLFIRQKVWLRLGRCKSKYLHFKLGHQRVRHLVWWPCKHFWKIEDSNFTHSVNLHFYAYFCIFLFSFLFFSFLFFLSFSLALSLSLYIYLSIYYSLYYSLSLIHSFSFFLSLAIFFRFTLYFFTHSFTYLLHTLSFCSFIGFPFEMYWQRMRRRSSKVTLISIGFYLGLALIESHAEMSSHWTKKILTKKVNKKLNLLMVVRF